MEGFQGMEETVKSETHLTSAAAFVEGGIQDACDDACSICLEDFCDSDPSTVTSCKHEFHLQCVLEWCQRSSQCPMCWRPISLKDPTSQELLEVVERERSFRFNPSRNATIFHHPTLGDFELQHLPVGANDAELEERIIQHLAAAAAMGRRHIARREGQRNRSQGQGRPQFLVFSSQHNTSPADTIPSSPTHGERESVPSNAVATPSSGSTNVSDVSSQVIMQVASGGQADVASPSASTSILLGTNQQDNYMNTRSSPNQSSPSSQQTATVSEFQSFSESIKSKFNAVSMRYKESISKSTRGWKERFFSRNSSMADQDSEVRRDANDGAATLSHMMEKLETRDGTTTSTSSTSNREESSSHSAAELDNERILEPGGGSPMSDTDLPASCSAASCSH